ncbi:MAG: type II restriction endonuclease [Bryobacteraceae bacterium]
MALADLADWLDEYDQPGFVWYVKRLAANDTLATGSHQAGPYVPKEFMFGLFPSLNTTATKDPDVWFDLYIESHPDHRSVRAIYYNTKPRGEGTRNEVRITNFGGSQSAIRDPESTGALTIFAFAVDEAGKATECHVWVSGHETEDDQIEERVGPVEPREHVVWTPVIGRVPEALGSVTRRHCHLADREIPPAWLARFPTGEEIIRKAVELRGTTGMNPDQRIIHRRACEYEIFQSVERVLYLPRILEGFTTVDGFVGLAQKILQSRKSRSGNSLELHARQIFIEEGLRSMHDFQYKPVIEEGGDRKRPDFLFPSREAYESQDFPESRLRMLAVKTTCKDRWRQITCEADRIRTKHLLTLQEGVSEGQFREMRGAGVQLVVPAGLHKSFPTIVRPHLLSLESFIADVRLSAI